MEATKHDLSLNSVKFDYQALKSTSLLAIRMLKHQISSCLNSIDDEFEKKINTNEFSSMASIQANAIIGHSKQLATAIETYYSLVHGEKRSEKSFVNL
jgi:hypothetical protein